MKKIYLSFSLIAFLVAGAFAQTATIKGKVIDNSKEGLAGATVVIKGTTTGSSADFDGNYSFDTAPGTYTLEVSFVGYETKTKPVTVTEGDNVFNFTLGEGDMQLSELVVVGSRNPSRTVLESPVPVDVINLEEMAINSPQISVNQLLNYVAPSFTSNTQTISDGTDHIDPASLRGLGPDQVLVLINGKRRHNSSLVNVNGTFGRGSVGTDLNAIPVASIKRIEVLRDGAAAQYGSDAIAGVINIVLKESVNELSVDVTSGAYVSKESEDGMDGKTVQFNMNYGLPVGDNGGVINFTGNFDSRGYTNRMREWEGQIFSDYNNPTDYPNPTGADITDAELLKRGLTRSDFNMRVGQSAVDNAGGFVNFILPVGENAEIYSFGGLTYRRGDAAGFYRLPYQSRAVTDIYPNGFLPEIHSNILDKSFALGIRGEVNDWKIDFSNSFGSNSFQYQIENTLNASLGASSPTSFNSGGFSFAQNTTNFDLSRYWDDVLSGFNLALGAEYRVDNYQIFAGEEGSYTNYGLASWQVSQSGDSTLVVDYKGPINTVFGLDGSARPGGAQVFPGFSPDNALNKFRSNASLYVDAEADLTENITLTGALRYENYSDFGSTFNWKTSFRAKLVEGWSLRGAASTGFRAPSLHQQYFNSTSTIFVDGVPSEVGTFSNDSRPAQLLGIPQLKQETSNNYSVGFTGQIGDDLSLTVDGYMVNIADRIVYTGQFSGVDGGTAKEQEVFDLLAQANATAAAFFANAIDTKTKGVDIVLTHKLSMGAEGGLRTSLAATLSQTLLDGDIKTSDALIGKESTYFDETSRIFLERAVPRTKVNLTFDYSVNKKFSLMLRNVYFGAVSEATNSVDNQQEFAAKVITDLSFNYKVSDNLSFVVGSSNLLDTYPDAAIEANRSGGRFNYSRRSQQFGANGRFVFAKLAFNIK